MASDFLEIIEVSPRDGIQNEQILLSTDQKLGLIGRAIGAGLGLIGAALLAVIRSSRGDKIPPSA